MDYSTSVAYNYNEITKEYNKCYPQTHMNAVYTKDDETETLGNKLSDIDDKIDDNINKIGDLENLTTTDNTNLVNAINSIVGNVNVDNNATILSLKESINEIKNDLGIMPVDGGTFFENYVEWSMNGGTF